MSDTLQTEMPRPPSDTVQIAIRVPTEWLRRADLLLPKIASAGVAATRTDAFRAAIARGFEALEEDWRVQQVKRWERFKARALEVMKQETHESGDRDVRLVRYLDHELVIDFGTGEQAQVGHVRVPYEPSDDFHHRVLDAFRSLPLKKKPAKRPAKK